VFGVPIGEAVCCTDVPAGRLYGLLHIIVVDGLLRAGLS
jgi:hypothetical protein